jgi:hypothetical protein
MHTLSTVYQGKLLAGERGFVREFWSPHLPDVCDADALLPPPGALLDAAAAFARCQAAAMDMAVPSWVAGLRAGA